MITNQLIINSLTLYEKNSNNKEIRNSSKELLKNLNNEKKFIELLNQYILYFSKKIEENSMKDSNNNTIPDERHAYLDVLENIKRILNS
jgi:tagatose-1,6-bisphosphate aldolase non-catalytic subunit AgaZ/GatZ